MTGRITQLQALVQASDSLHINTEWLDYAGVVE
ncbi:MAG TPA: dehydrogenase, partial [Gammaproteobacteria bacterium]|nr:dehydrogenase [Gammaproteobacteria bacterium]